MDGELSHWNTFDSAQLLIGIDLIHPKPAIGRSINGLATVGSMCSTTVSAGIIEVK